MVLFKFWKCVLHGKGDPWLGFTKGLVVVVRVEEVSTTLMKEAFL